MRDYEDAGASTEAFQRRALERCNRHSLYPNMTTKIIIEDHVVPQLLTSAIEAYEIKHKAHLNGKEKSAIETYGLLWGYVLPERHGQNKRIVSTIATIETSALRHEDWVKPNLESLIMKKDFFQKYWSHLELVGTFHSHPYKTLSEVNHLQGWRASNADLNHFPWIHKNLSPELPCMAHIIITIAALKSKGSAFPQSLAGGESSTGFVLSSDYRKFWIKGFSSEAEFFVNDDDKKDANYESSYDIRLDIPSLEKRFR